MRRCQRPRAENSGRRCAGCSGRFYTAPAAGRIFLIGCSCLFCKQVAPLRLHSSPIEEGWGKNEVPYSRFKKYVTTQGIAKAKPPHRRALQLNTIEQLWTHAHGHLRVATAIFEHHVKSSLETGHFMDSVAMGERLLEMAGVGPTQVHPQCPPLASPIARQHPAQQLPSHPRQLPPPQIPPPTPTPGHQRSKRAKHQESK